MGKIEVAIEHKQTIQKPVLLDGITLCHEIGLPSKLTFTAVKTAGLDFEEGDVVKFYYNGEGIFKGYVFTKKRTDLRGIAVTAYDQTRYLNNRDSLKYSATATEMIKQTAAICGLETGDMENTGVIINRREDNVSYRDMIETALKITKTLSGEEYVFFDDFGKLTLKNVRNMIMQNLVTERCVGGFDYATTIDKNVYTSVKLYRDKGKDERETYAENDAEGEKKWGLIRLYKKAENETMDLSTEANALLRQYCKKNRLLKVKNFMGDIRTRAGCLLPTQMNLGDLSVKQYLMAESVEHCFKNGLRSINVELQGINA